MSSDCICAAHCGCIFAGPLLRIGVVTDQDASLARLRVRFDELDQMISYWLPVVVPKTQDDKLYWLPDVGEQVVCLMDARDEDGVVLGAIYSQADATPVQSSDKYHLGFKDGTAFEYDRAAHVTAANFSDSSSLRYDGGAHSLSMNFSDQSKLKYDASAHRLTITFTDSTTIDYDASIHLFSVTGGAGTSITMNAPVQISLQSGSSFVNISPDAVTINPPPQ